MIARQSLLVGEVGRHEHAPRSRARRRPPTRSPRSWLRPQTTIPAAPSAAAATAIAGAEPLGAAGDDDHLAVQALTANRSLIRPPQ